MTTLAPSTAPASEAGAATEYPFSDRETTVAPSESCYSSDATSDTEVIDLLDDDGSDFGDDGADRKASPAPTTASSSSSVQVLATVKAPTPPPQPDENKPIVRRGRQPGSTIQGFLTDAQQAQIVSLREAGWNNIRIAEHLNRSPNTISSFLRRRRLRINQLVATLPGSIPPAPKAGRTQPLVPKAEDVKPNLAGPAGRGRVPKRERDVAPSLGVKQEEPRDTRPAKRAKKEEPL